MQSFFGGRKAKKSQKELENLQSPTYNPNEYVLSYYNNALQRYNVNPYNSTLYKTQQQNIGRGVNQGIGALNNRRSGLAGISSLIQGQNDSLLKAGIAAENQKDQRFSQLGGATQMKAGEDRQAFNINKMQPFERKYNLLAMKAGANARTANDGLKNIFNGLGTMAGGYQLGQGSKSSGGGGQELAMQPYMF
ncbi:MAG: hypothetical protein IPJ81_06760 [Chitinophagaceae bacterium]|nr:hypothetical protein [Chitinophagaceae bacterium]